MTQIHDLSQGDLREIWDAIRDLRYATNQNHMAIGRSGMSVYDGGAITIENGGLYVTGSATISGELIADGTITMTGIFTATGDVNLNGPVDIAGATTITGDVTSAGHFTQTGPTDLNGTTTVAGDTTVTGDFTVNGPMKTTSTLSVEGVTTLKNDLNVTTGKIVAGDVTIDPGYFDGSLKFANGSYLAATPNGAQLVKGSGAVTVSTSQADMGVGLNAIIVNSTGTFLNNLPTTTEPANLYISEGGRVYRSTA
ncbi:hypothetical protein [Arthrobacter sp. StoSoilB13]|uniref:hypothetical protein n=1 Tax=Arthrobacter sp. StoSoilB13 TaxID=2830993 RepID=UPI001CC6CC62|nr:hypothetical protein [Arthrobacter sp. StoSoilB13]BCW47898.1 hypothetical protein StoSoilB13_02400 [Arthrobacter sp. StoSoilB13]